MPITLKDLASMSQEEIEAQFPSQKCRCGGRIEEHPDEQYRLSEERVCSDCYFSELGDGIEKHPIYNPTRR